MACARSNRQACARHRSRLPTNPGGNKTGLSLCAAMDPLERFGKLVVLASVGSDPLGVKLMPAPFRVLESTAV